MGFCYVASRCVHSLNSHQASTVLGEPGQRKCKYADAYEFAVRLAGSIPKLSFSPSYCLTALPLVSVTLEGKTGGSPKPIAGGLHQSGMHAMGVASKTSRVPNQISQLALLRRKPKRGGGNRAPALVAPARQVASFRPAVRSSQPVQEAGSRSQAPPLLRTALPPAPVTAPIRASLTLATPLSQAPPMFALASSRPRPRRRLRP